MNYEQKFIEIPFGANDSELKGWEYTIPKGMEAIVKDGKVIIKEKESEDERIRKEIIKFIQDFYNPCDPEGDKWIAYLEKLKEPPKEELVYRLNGLMQEYIKEGKDEEEREHRFKCYQLFWDALEDADFFEQKEQKPAECIPDSIKFDEGFKTGREIGFREGVESVKPAEWSEEDENALEYLHELIGFGYSEKFMDAQTAADMREWVNEHLRPVSYKNCNSRWKPSEEQMKALERTTRLANFGLEEDRRKALVSLYKQLKALM